MKSRKVKIAITSAVLAVLLAVISVGYTFAWFADYQSINILLYTDDDGAYFAGGDGTEDDPYQISSYKHLYNLAWLQNEGKFDNTTNTPTYFKLMGTIDMYVEGSGYCVIPPIGNDDHPFTGVFNGNGNTIKKLVVSTDKNKLSNTDVAAASSYTFSSYVGLFGNTGGESNIYNFILDNPIVEVANENTAYSSGSSACVGLAIGYVANAASSIGVIGGYLSVQKSDYTTYNSILGEIADGVKTSITGGDDDTKTSGTTVTTGGDTGYFIPDVFYEKLVTNKLDSGGLYSESSSSYAYQFKSTIWLTSVNGLKDSETDTEYDSSDYLGLGSFSLITGSNATAIRSHNIYGKQTSDDDNTATDINIGEVTKEETDGTITAITGTSDTTNTFQLGDGSKKANNIVDPSGKVYTDLNYSFYFNNAPELLSSTPEYEVVTENPDLDALDNGDSAWNIYSYCILVNITSTTNSKLVMIIQANTSSNNTRSVGVTKVVDASKIDSDFDFATDYKKFATSGNVLSFSTNPKNNAVGEYEFIYGNPTYYEISLSEGAGIYSINSTGNGFHLCYLAVTGVDDGSTGTTTDTSSDGTYNSSCGVSAIDFIYSGVTISTSTFNFITDSSTETVYIPTGTMIYLSTDASTATTAVLVIAYIRSSDYEGYYESTKTHTIHISYSGTDTPTGSDDSVVDKDTSLSGFTVPSTGDKIDTG